MSPNTPRATLAQPVPDAQLLHNRAAESAKETRQLIVAMSTASIGVFFLALSDRDPAASLDRLQVNVVLAAITLMAATTFAGLWSAYSDAQWSYYWAQEIEARQKRRPPAKWIRGRARWHCHKRWSERASLVLFALGVLAASVYLVTLTLAG